MMSAFGTKQTALSSQTMSAFGGKSDVGCAGLLQVLRPIEGLFFTGLACVWG
jgi:hypothetical protein